MKTGADLHTDRQGGRQIDRRIDRQKDRQTDLLIGRQTDRQSDRRSGVFGPERSLYIQAIKIIEYKESSHEFACIFRA